MSDLFEFYHERYNYDDTFAVIRSVIYFVDAENTIEPECLDGMTWGKVKKTIKKAFDVYHKNIINNGC